MMENITTIVVLQICNIKTLPVTDATKLNFLINGIFSITLSVLIVLFNGAVLWTLFTKTKTTSAGASKILLIVLSIVDFVSGCTHIPMRGVMSIEFSTGIVDCILYKTNKVLGYTATMMSAFIILCISGEYYLSLVKPLLRSKKQDYYFGIQLVVISLLLLVTYILFHGVYTRRSSLLVFISAFVMLVVYVCISILHFKIYQEMGRMRKRSLRHTQSKRVVCRAVKRTFKMLVVISLAFAVCFVPFIVLSAYQAVFGESAFTMNFIRVWCDTGTTVNAIVDPAVYCLRLKSVRENCWPVSFLRRCALKKSLKISDRKIAIGGSSNYKSQTPV